MKVFSVILFSIMLILSLVSFVCDLLISFNWRGVRDQLTDSLRSDSSKLDDYVRRSHMCDGCVEILFVIWFITLLIAIL